MEEEKKEYITEWKDDGDVTNEVKLLNKKRKNVAVKSKPEESFTEVEVSDAFNLTDEQKRRCKNWHFIF
jgi:hypothetical protein